MKLNKISEWSQWNATLTWVSAISVLVLALLLPLGVQNEAEVSIVLP